MNKDKLICEKQALAEKMNKLYAFMLTPQFENEVPEDVKYLLKLQYKGMSIYHSALKRRIELIGGC